MQHIGASPANDDNDSDVDDEESGGLSNSIESQASSEGESINQGELEPQLPPTFDPPCFLPSMSQ